MFLNADIFLNALHQNRTCWIKGRYGGGKTLLTVAIAQHFNRSHGYHIYSNIPIYLDGVINEMQKCSCDRCQAKYHHMEESGVEQIPQYHTLVAYDEAWLSFRRGARYQVMEAYLAYIRKVDLIMVMPSVMQMHRDAAQMWCTRLRNFGTFGLPIWLYEWGITGQSSKDSGGKFILWRPQKFFGTYDTYAQPTAIEGLFDETIKAKRQTINKLENQPVRTRERLQS